jgi:prophage DNA circulation protein
MFDWFTKKAKKEELEQLKGAVQTGFNTVKEDISNISKWISHLNEQGERQDDEISDIYDELSSIRSEVENVKNMIDILGNKKLFKQKQTVFNKQTAVQAVQTPVQTAVQSTFLDNFLDNLSITERAMIWVLLNSDLKLSYDDLAAMLGKERATIRGQLNSIKQKSDGLIAEQIEGNNKKRFYIPDKVKGMMLKKVKVRLKRRGKKGKK